MPFGRPVQKGNRSDPLCAVIDSVDSHHLSDSCPIENLRPEFVRQRRLAERDSSSGVLKIKVKRIGRRLNVQKNGTKPARTAPKKAAGQADVSSRKKGMRSELARENCTARISGISA